MNLERNRVIQLIPFEKLPQKRLHPARITNAYLSGKTCPIVSTQSNSEFPLKDSRPLTDEEQEEKLALEGIMIHWMVDGANKMRNQRPPYGLIYLDNGFNEGLSTNNMKVVKDANLLGDPFTTFPAAIRHTFAYALEEKRKQISAVPERHEAAIYRKYMEYVHRNGGRLDDPHGIKFIVFSSNVGLRMMGDILAHASDIDSTALGRKVTVDESANAARNSTPLLTKLSSLEQKVFDIIHGSMGTSGVWESLTIVEHEGKMYYQIKNSVLLNAISQLSEPKIKEEVEKNKRSGCPARMRFEGKKSAIETLWNWYIDYTIEASRNL